MDRRVQVVIALMSENLTRGLTLPKMARAAGMSPSHLCRIFKNETQRTPKSYLKQLRMERARRLLEETSLSVKQIKAKVGVNDESHFVRDFQAVYGMSPAKYRAHHRNGESA